MKKIKLISVLISVLTIFGFINGFAQVEKVGEDLYWNVKDGKLIISGTGSMYNMGVYPWHEYKDQFQTIVIEKGVTTIGEYAFAEYDHITDISFPTTLKEINNHALAGWGNMDSIDLPDSLTVLGEGCFHQWTSLKKITIPNSVTSIGDGCFGFCWDLDSVILPESLTLLGEGSFRECTSLKTINIPKGVTSIGAYCFAQCSALDTIYALNPAPPECGENVFQDVNSQDVTIYVPSNSASKYKASPGWDNFVSFVEFPYGNCGNEATWSFNENILTISGSGATEDYHNKEEERIIPWLSYTKSIKKVIIEEGITAIGSELFYGCSSLDSINIPDSVRSIGVSAFEGCTSLTFVSISENVSRIEDNTFTGCDSLLYVVCNGETPPEIDEDIYPFSDSIKNATLYVLSRSIAAYDTAYVWKDFGRIISFEDATLKSLTVTGGDSLLIDFNPDKTYYTVNVPYKIDNISIGVELNSPNAYLETEGDVGAKSLKVGSNVFRYRVKCNHSVETVLYEVHVVRGENPNTGLPAVNEIQAHVYRDGSSLWIDTPVSEQITVYSINGNKLYSLEKLSGKTSISINHKGLLIIKGSSGWVRKII